MVKFKCKKCGYCCRNFGISSRIKEAHLPVFEWEVKELKKIARARGVELGIRPCDVFLDKNSDTAFCCMYGLFNEPCPFLKNDKCSVYKKKPLICKMFPFFCTPEFTTNGFNLGCFWKCKNFDNAALMGRLKGKAQKELIKELKKTYGDNYDYCFKGSFIRKCIEDLIVRYALDKTIDIIEVEPKDYQKYKIIPFFDFLVERKIIDSKRKKRIINKMKEGAMKEK